MNEEAYFHAMQGYGIQRVNERYARCINCASYQTGSAYPPDEMEQRRLLEGMREHQVMCPHNLDQVVTIVEARTYAAAEDAAKR